MPNPMSCVLCGGALVEHPTCEDVGIASSTRCLTCGTVGEVVQASAESSAEAPRLPDPDRGCGRDDWGASDWG